MSPGPELRVRIHAQDGKSACGAPERHAIAITRCLPHRTAHRRRRRRGGRLMTMPLPAGCFIRMDKPDLQALIDRLREWGYRVIGPTISQEAVVYADIASVRELPIGCVDQQEAGHY